MRIKVVLFLLASGLLVTAAWMVRGPGPVQADEVPQKYRATVHKGLEYLAKSQHKDGHWEGDGGKHPVAMTGLVGLALLMERANPRTRGLAESVVEAKYAANIRKAVDWLIDKSQAGRDGLIYSDHASETSRYMEGHGLATLFLAGVCQQERDEARRKKLTDVLTRAVKYIVKAQSTQGGWYHTSKVEGHDFDVVSATVIQIQALQAAENAGIPSGVIRDAQEYLKKALAKYEQKGQPEPNRSRLADTAGAFACRSNANPEDEWCKKWLLYCLTEISKERDVKLGKDELIHYYYAQALYNSGENWPSYRTALFDTLQSKQNKDGSWPASEGISVGPVYATALWCTILQLDNRSHPSFRQIAVLVT